MTITEQIKKYLLENPVDRSKENPYADAALRFNVDKEYIRGIWRKLRKKGLVETGYIDLSNVIVPKNSDVYNINNYSNSVSEFRVNGNNATVTKNTSEEVKSLEDLIRVCEIDTKTWKIDSWQCKKWDLGIKNNQEQIETKALFSVSAKLSVRKVDTDLGLQKNVLLDEIKAYIKDNSKKVYKDFEFKVSGGLLLEIAIFDAHFGKLAHAEESGEDYDLKIAGERFTNAVEDLLSKVDVSAVTRILFPIGNDLFNVDNFTKSTFNLTPQDSDTRFHKMVKFVRALLIETIDKLSTIAPVDVIIVVGNHDTTVTYMTGEILDAFYYNNPNVVVNNEATLRKYYSFGNNSFMFTHGDREKQADLGMIFAAEKPHVWANSIYRFIQLGHYHHNKKINYLSNNEFQGFQIQILPSLSPNDAWHTGKGYSALRQAKAFLYDQQDGLIAELTHNVKK